MGEFEGADVRRGRLPIASHHRDPIKRIAQRCGFGSEETMRRGFFRQVGIAPQDYRARFSSPAA